MECRWLAMSTLSSPCRVYWSARASELLNFSTGHGCNCCSDRECTSRNAQTVGKTKHSTRQRSYCYIFGMGYLPLWVRYVHTFGVCEVHESMTWNVHSRWTDFAEGIVTYIPAPNQRRMDGRTENCSGNPGRYLSRHVVHYVVYLVAGKVPKLSAID
jgi:hypothetical protein